MDLQTWFAQQPPELQKILREGSALDQEKALRNQQSKFIKTWLKTPEGQEYDQLIAAGGNLSDEGRARLQQVNPDRAWAASIPPEVNAIWAKSTAANKEAASKTLKGRLTGAMDKIAPLIPLAVGAAGLAPALGAAFGAGGAGAASGVEAQLVAAGMAPAEAAAVAAQTAAATAAEGGIASGVGAAAAGGGAGAALEGQALANAMYGGSAAGEAGGYSSALGGTAAPAAAAAAPAVATAAAPAAATAAAPAAGGIGSALADYGPAALKVAGAALPLLAPALAGGGGGGGGSGGSGGGGSGGSGGPSGMLNGGVLGPSGLMGSPQEKEAQSNQLAQTRADWANRPNQTDMYGNQTQWTTEAVLDPATGQMVNKWSNKIVLDPQQQAAVDSEKAIKAGMMSNAQGLMGQAGAALSQPMDYSKFQGWGATPQGDDAARQRIEGMLFDRLRPEQEQDRSNLEARVAAMGITRGMPQWDREMQKLMDQQSRSRFDAMQYAGNEMQNQFNRDTTSAEYQNTLRGSQIAEEQARRMQPLNDMNALRQGNQVAAPQFGQFGASRSAGGVDYSAQYDNQTAENEARQASYGNALTNFGTTVGSAVAAIPWQQRTPGAMQPQPGVMNGGYNAQTGQPK